ncbi:MAG: hypothetical protein LBU13_02435 [Synergistaceae bacterium]|jgi:hypothetical protein|nr:hypothetical protein [Synergistaceae bacterium]
MRKKLLLVLSVLMILAQIRTASADIFYAASNYEAGMVGQIRGSSSSGYVIDAKMVSNFNGDAQGLSFIDHDGNLRAMVRERASGAGDVVSIYAPSDFSRPILNHSGFGSNIHAVTSYGDDLYLVTYESYPSGPEDTGEVIRVDMRNGYALKARYQYQRFVYDGFLPAAGSINWAWPHGEGVMVHNNKVYVMFGISDPSKIVDYAPTEIVEFNRDLTPTGDKAILKEGIQIGKNSLTMAMHNGKLYVGCIGGRQGVGVFGDVWEINLGDANTAGDMSARQVLDFEQVTGVLAGAGWGAYGIDFTDDGTAFILAGGYDNSMDYKGRLLKIPAGELTKGGQDAINALEIKHDFTDASGHSWWDGVTWDAKSSTVWCMAGTHLFALDKDGNFKRDFTPSELGEDIYSVALLNEPQPRGPGVVAADPPEAAKDFKDGNVVAVPKNKVSFFEIGSEEDVLEKLSEENLTVDLDGRALFQLGGAGQLELDVWAVEGENVNISSTFDHDSVTPIPVFRAESGGSGSTSLVTVKMDFKGTKLVGYDFDKLMLMKLKNDGTTLERFRRVNDWTDMTDGTFIVTDEEENQASGTIAAAAYLISAAVRDGGDYDWSADNNIVIDPNFMAIESDPEDPPASGGGMPSGCAAGSSGLMVLAALGLLLYGRKRG